MWNKQMEASLETTFGYRPTDYQGLLLKGYFQGIAERNGNKYYHFVIPDAFRNSEINGIEVLVPLASNDKNAKITMLDTFEQKGSPVYIKYMTSIGYEEKEERQIAPLSKYAPQPEVIQETVPFDYPAFMAFSLPYYSSGAYIRIGQPVNGASLSINPDLHKKSNLVCRKIGSNHVNIQPSNI